MVCGRCNGLMVSEQICDLQGMSNDLCADGYRCLLCGNIVDTTILKHRKGSTEALDPASNLSARTMGLVAV